MAITRIRLFIHTACAAIVLIGFVLFAWLYYTRYYIWLECFRESGRCYDFGSGDVYTTNGFVWGLFAAISLVSGILNIIAIRRQLRVIRGDR